MSKNKIDRLREYFHVQNEFVNIVCTIQRMSFVFATDRMVDEHWNPALKITENYGY